MDQGLRRQHLSCFQTLTQFNKVKGPNASVAMLSWPDVKDRILSYSPPSWSFLQTQPRTGARQSAVWPQFVSAAAEADVLQEQQEPDIGLGQPRWAVWRFTTSWRPV